MHNINFNNNSSFISTKSEMPNKYQLGVAGASCLRRFFFRLETHMFIENLGIACGHSRSGFFRPQKNAPGFSAAKKAHF